MLYQVLYNDGKMVKSYCLNKMTLEEATKQLNAFKSRYLNEDGTGKCYPNGKGYYPFTNPRITPA